LLLLLLLLLLPEMLRGWLMEEMVLAVADMTFGSRQTVLGVATNAIFQFFIIFRSNVNLFFNFSL
jgi:hypothetical protein